MWGLWVERRQEWKIFLSMFLCSIKGRALLQQTLEALLLYHSFCLKSLSKSASSQLKASLQTRMKCPPMLSVSLGPGERCTSEWDRVLALQEHKHAQVWTRKEPFTRHMGPTVQDMGAEEGLINSQDSILGSQLPSGITSWVLWAYMTLLGDSL